MVARPYQFHFRPNFNNINVTNEISGAKYKLEQETHSFHLGLNSGTCQPISNLLIYIYIYIYSYFLLNIFFYE